MEISLDHNTNTYGATVKLPINTDAFEYHHDEERVTSLTQIVLPLSRDKYTHTYTLTRLFLKRSISRIDNIQQLSLDLARKRANTHDDDDDDDVTLSLPKG